MAETARAVFLSYASEDGEAAQHVADALRAAGVEVWFDRSELRGGDAWDRNIRDQIHHCQLFLPIISAHSEARDEGYFRREWALAEARTLDMSHKRAFLVPVVIDGTSERGAAVPEKFLDVQWTRLPGGNADPAFVERVKRLLMAEVAPSQPPVSSGGDRVVQATPSRGSRRRWFVGVAVAAAVFALAVGYIMYGGRGAEAPVAQTANSIAVLPLTNESGDPNQQYFSDGLSENLITALTQFPGLKIIGRTSAFQFRDSKEDAHSIGTKLGVARLLEGSVQRAGEMVRVRAELIGTTDGSTQWSERYDRPYKDLFALQDEIARAVVGALRSKLLPGSHAQAQDERPPSGNLEAYSALLQGKFFLARRNEADNRMAIEQLTRATQLDPNYAMAWSKLSSAWTGLAIEYLELDKNKDALNKGRVAADRALALSPNLAAAHLARGEVLVSPAYFDWRGSDVEYRRALDLAPNDGEAKHSVAVSSAILGDPETAVRLTKESLATDPLEANRYGWLASFFVSLNRLDEAEKAIRTAIKLQPTGEGEYSALAQILAMRGDAQGAIDAAQRESSQLNRYVALAVVQQLVGNRNEADKALKTLIDKAAGWGPVFIADIYALRGDAQATFDWLDRAWRARDPSVALILTDTFVSRFKNDPRLAAFCRKVGLPVPGENRTAPSG